LSKRLAIAAPIRPVPAMPIFNGSSIVCDMAVVKLTLATPWRQIGAR
jgi:hypothetical protein